MQTTARYALGVVLVATLTVGCGEATTPAEPLSEREGLPIESWSPGATSPLSPRFGSMMSWTGTEVLVFGGRDSVPCPPNADCVSPGSALTDGAAYDPVADTWRELPKAPFAVTRESGHAIVGDQLVVSEGRDWALFDAARDAWVKLPSPPRPGRVAGPGSALDGRIYVSDGARGVQVLDLAGRTWSSIPADQVAPPLDDVMIFATQAGVLLSGMNYDEAAPDEPTFQQVDLWDGRGWRRLPRTGQLGWFYHWTGERLLGTEQGGADGGQVNGWGEWHPYGGTLDPLTGTWTPLDGLPGQRQERPLLRPTGRLERRDRARADGGQQRARLRRPDP